MADNKLLGASGLYYGSNEISKAYMGNNLIFEKSGETGPDYSKEYFCIKSLEDNNTITFTKHNQNSSYIAADKQIMYSKDLITWTVISFVTDSSSQIVLNSGEKLYLKGNNSAYGERFNYYNSGANILSSGNIDVMGNIMSLIYGDDFINNNNNIEPYAFLYLFFKNTKILNAKDLILAATTIGNYCYDYMFYNCSSLVTAPELPATTLGEYCYRAMFYNCSSLTTAPALPATTLSTGCYLQMFYNCSSLVTAPELPATTLSTSCYYQMFYNCSSLVTAPTELPATTLVSNCYREMFYNCTSLVTAPELPATALGNYCYREMFYNCSSLTTAPELPATTLVSSCYYRMFLNCSSLTTAPELPATTLVNYCYYRMFLYCTKLNYIKAMFTTTPSSTYTDYWVYGVSSRGTFVKNSSATWNVIGYNGIPSGWTVQTASS